MPQSSQRRGRPSLESRADEAMPECSCAPSHHSLGWFRREWSARLSQCSGMSPERHGAGLYLIASPNALVQRTRLRFTEQAKSKNLDQPFA